MVFMDKQPSREEILKKTLRVLVKQVGLLPAEVADLRLSHLHLAGKSPNLSFTPAGANQPKKVELDLDAHRALVGWLVARPDSVTDLLFPGAESDGLTSEYIEAVTGGVAPAPAAPPASPVPPPLDETIVAARPTPSPRSAPEFGRPPFGRPDETQSRPFSPPPLTVPEADLPAAPPVPPEAPVSAPEAGLPELSPFPPRPTGPRKPPPPIRKRDDEPAAPALVKQKPEPPAPLSGAVRPPVATEPVRPVAADASILPDAAPTPQPEVAAPPVPTEPVQPIAAEAPVLPEAAPVASQPEVAAPSPEPVEAVPPAAAEAPVAPQPETVAPLPVETPPVAAAPAPAEQEAAPPAPVKAKAQPPKPPKAPAGAKSTAPRSAAMLPIALSSVLAVVVLCIVCAGAGGGLYLFNSDSGSQLLAGLGLAPAETPAVEIAPEPAAGETPTAESSPTANPTFESPVSPVSPIDTPTATATLPPTSTPTLLPPTNTPPPAEQKPTDAATPTTPPTTPPTATPEPAATAAEAKAAATPTPAQSPTPAASPTPAMKYEARKLLTPDDGARYDGINEITLKWEAVPELAADEQYAVRIIYKFNNQITYGGAQVKEAQWVVPQQLYRQIDPPEHRYEWFVVVERLNKDGSGTAISPESERRSFVWN